MANARVMKVEIRNVFPSRILGCERGGKRIVDSSMNEAMVIFHWRGDDMPREIAELLERERYSA